MYISIVWLSFLGKKSLLLRNLLFNLKKLLIIMKNLILGLLAFSVVFTACNSDSSTAEKSATDVTTQNSIQAANEIRDAVNTEIPEDTVNVAKIQFVDQVFDYGTVKEGEVVEHSFKFKNVGVAPLTITKAKSTCGCTVPEFPKEAIAPGEEGEISVRFNTKGKSGRNKKPVNVTANTWPTVTTVHIDGTVEKDESAQAADNKAKTNK